MWHGRIKCACIYRSLSQSLSPAQCVPVSVSVVPECVLFRFMDLPQTRLESERSAAAAAGAIRARSHSSRTLAID